jgi:hypothetical protein
MIFHYEEPDKQRLSAGEYPALPGPNALRVCLVAELAAVCRLGLKHSVGRAALCVVEEASNRRC